MEPKGGDKYSNSFLRDTGKVENRVAVRIFVSLGVRVLDLVTWVDPVLQILGAAPATCVQQPPRVRGAPPQLRGILGRGPSASRALQNMELKTAAREKCAVKDANASPEMLPACVCACMCVSPGLSLTCCMDCVETAAQGGVRSAGEPLMATTAEC